MVPCNMTLTRNQGNLHNKHLKHKEDPAALEERNHKRAKVSLCRIYSVADLQGEQKEWIALDAFLRR